MPLVPVPETESQPWVKDWFHGYNTLPLAENPGGPCKVFDFFDHAARYVKATGKRVYLGEFGAIDVADRQSRVNYVWLVRTEAERGGIGWAYWDDDGSFKLMNPPTGTLNDGLKLARWGSLQIVQIEGGGHSLVFGRARSGSAERFQRVRRVCATPSC